MRLAVCKFQCLCFYAKVLGLVLFGEEENYLIYNKLKQLIIGWQSWLHFNRFGYSISGMYYFNKYVQSIGIIQEILTSANSYKFSLHLVSLLTV